MKTSFSKTHPKNADTAIVLAFSGGVLGSNAQKLDDDLNGVVTRAINGEDFDGKSGKVLSVLAPEGGKYARLFVLGLGDADALSAASVEKSGGSLYAALAGGNTKNAVLIADDPASDKKNKKTGKKKAGGMTGAEIAAHLVYGAKLRAYRFDKYFTKKDKKEKPSLARLDVMSEDAAKAKKLYAPLDAVADGVYFTRDLVSEPANELFPGSFAKRLQKEFKDTDVTVKVYTEKQLEKMGMHSLLSVGLGSQHDTHMAVMTYNGGKSGDKPVVFVGKGVCFDSGGISIKPGAGMAEMKWDMAGAGVVSGVMKALSGRKARVNAIGIVALTENMPSGTAIKPGDVVKSYSGQTIEIHNTDAEGRRALADALWYAQEKYKPAAMINLATLTGAVLVALGDAYAGVMGNNDDLCADLIAAGENVEEHLWQLPLCEAYDKAINSDIADMKDISGNRYAGSSIGGAFLKRFVKDSTKWAHIDIAGVTWSSKDTPVVPKGGTAFGVRLLDNYVSSKFEK